MAQNTSPIQPKVGDKKQELKFAWFPMRFGKGWKNIKWFIYYHQTLEYQRQDLEPAGDDGISPTAQLCWQEVSRSAI